MTMLDSVLDEFVNVHNKFSCCGYSLPKILLKHRQKAESDIKQPIYAVLVKLVLHGKARCLFLLCKQ